VHIAQLTVLSLGAEIGDVIPKGIVIGPFNYAESNGYLKIWTGCLWGKSGMGRG
jgi:hypothetical protein